MDGPWTVDPGEPTNGKYVKQNMSIHILRYHPINRANVGKSSKHNQHQSTIINWQCEYDRNMQDMSSKKWSKILVFPIGIGAPTRLSLDRTPKLVILCSEVWDFHEFEVVVLEIQGAHSIGVEGHKVDHTILHEGIGKP